MEDWGGELEKAWNTLMQFAPARRLKEAVVVAINKVSQSTARKKDEALNDTMMLPDRSLGVRQDKKLHLISYKPFLIRHSCVGHRQAHERLKENHDDALIHSIMLKSFSSC